MKAHLFCLALCLVGGILLAQTGSTPKNDLELHRISGQPFWPSSAKMLCDPATNPVSITSCDGETPINGDNNPEDGAFMQWTATGSSLYYVRIYSLTDTFEIFRTDFTDRTVFSPNDPDGTTLNQVIFVGDNITNNCLPEGFYTVQVWSVQDLDGDLLPDRDPTGAIIGCFVECSYEFRPSCASSTLRFFTVDARDIGCNGVGGSVRLYDFRTENLYCIDVDGGGTTINWTGPNNFTSNSTFIDNLEPGIYSVEVMDLYGCTAYWALDIVETDNVAFACSVVSGPTTLGGADGSAGINITAGLGEYNLYWVGPNMIRDSLLRISDGETVIPDLPAGTYTFTVRDLESTCEEDCTLVIPEPDCSDISAAIIELRNSDCDGNLNGRIAITFAGNFMPDLIWEGPGVDGVDTTVIENLGPGTYIYTVADARGCGVSDTIRIISEPSFTFNCGGVDETLPFLDDGRIGLTLAGGTPPFLLSYVAVDQAGDTLPPLNDQVVMDGDTIRNLSAGAYFLEITDQSGCQRTCIATIGEANCDIFPNCTPINPVSINGLGSVLLNFDSGPNWFVTVSGAKDTIFTTTDPNVLLTDLPQGDYAVSVYNTEGCTGSCTFSIIPPPCTLAATATASDPQCFNENSGRIAINITGAGNNLVVDWNVDAYDGRWVVGSLPPGTYRIHISDETQCPLDTIVFTLTNPDPFTVNLALANPILCFGDSTGAIRATTIGGDGPFRYDWSVDSLPDTSLVSGLIAATYSLAVTDANGCVAQDDITITQPPLLSMSCAATAESFAGVMDGTISIGNAGAENVVTLSGDLGNFTLTANTDTTFTDLGPGTYNLFITDSNGCTTECSAIVNPGPCQIGLMTTTTQPDCADALGSATGIPTNPFGAVRYQWSNGDTLATADSLAAGIYRLTVVDASGCEATGRVVISPFTDIPAVGAATVSGVCDDGCTDLQLSLVGTPPFTVDYAYRENGGAESFNSFMRNSSGTETICPGDLGLTSLVNVSLRLVNITDGNGCLRPIDRLLPINVFPPAVRQLDTVLCPGERINLFGEIFDASRPTGQTIIPIPSSNGCDSTVLVNLQYFAPAVSALDTTLCVGERFSFFGQVFTANRRSGRVLLPMPSSNGCDSMVDISINFFPVATGTLDTTLCPRERLNYFGQVFHANRTSGQVTIPNATVNGCDSLVDVSVTFREDIIGTVDTTICEFSRLNYYGQYFDANRTSGMVRLPILSAAGCDSSVFVQISLHESSPGRLDTAVCAGETLQFGDVFFDGPANNVLTQLDIPDQYGCDSLVFVTLREIPLPIIELSGDGIICPGGELEMTLTYDGPGIGTVVLSSNPNERISLVAGTTTISRPVAVGATVSILQVMSGGDCPAIGIGELLVRETDLAVNIDVISGDAVYAVSCADGDDGAVLAIPSGGLPPYTFQWNTGGQNAVLRDLPAGNYNVLVTSARGCQAAARVGLEAPEVLFAVTNEVEANCLDTLPSLILRDIQGGISPYLFRIGGNNAFLPVANFPDTLRLPVGRTVLEIEDINGCRLSETFNFSPPPEPQLVATPSLAVIPAGDSVRIQLLTNLDVQGFRLFPGPDSLIPSDVFYVAPTDNALYEITAMDSFGCRATTFVEVIIDDFVPIYTPNVFTPNGDGVNDVFRLFARPTVLAFSNFSIFNRWGGRVYYLEDTIGPNELNWGWDGYAENGKIHEQDVYIYTVTVELADGRTVEIAGDVLLLR